MRHARHPGRNLVHIRHRNGEFGFVRQPAVIRCPDSDGVTALGLVIERLRRFQLIAVDRERSVIGISRTGHQRVGERRTGRFGIRRGQDPNHGAGWLVLRHLVIGQCHIGGRRGQVDHGDRKGFFERQPAGIRRPHTNRVGILRLVVEGLGGLQLIAVNRERVVVRVAGTGHEAVGEGRRRGLGVRG